MIIFLRQSNIDPSAADASKLTLKDCCYIRVEYAEIFHDQVEFLPKNGIEHSSIIKSNSHNWIEPISGISYAFLFIEELKPYMPRKLEISYSAEVESPRHDHSDFIETLREM